MLMAGKVGESNGITWFGTTEDGLIKHSGTTWTYYTNTNSSLPSKGVFAIAVAANGVKWLGTDSGLVKLEGTTFTTYSAAAGLTSNKIVDNGIVIQKNGTIWIATADSGLYTFNGTSVVNHYDNSTQSVFYLYNNSALAVAVDSAQHVWVSIGMGVAEFNGTSWKKYSRIDDELLDSYFPGTSVSKIVVEPNGRKWFLAGYDGLIASGSNSAIRALSDHRPATAAMAVVQRANEQGCTFVLNKIPQAGALVIHTVSGQRIATLPVGGNSSTNNVSIVWNGLSGGKIARGHYIAGLVDNKGSRIAGKSVNFTLTN